MFRCLNCGQVFENEDIIWQAEYGHRIGYCRSCGWDELEPVDQCLGCGEYILNSEWFCERCIDNFEDEARRYFLGYLRDLKSRELKELGYRLPEILEDCIDLVDYEKRQTNHDDADHEPKDLVEE